jgi:hypothetical protein
MEIFCPNNLLVKLDFPAFGGPINAIKAVF